MLSYFPTDQTGLHSVENIPAPKTPTEHFPQMLYASGEGDAQVPSDARSRTQCGVSVNKTIPYLDTEAPYSHENPFTSRPVSHSRIVEQHRELFQAIDRATQRRFQCTYCGNLYLRQTCLLTHLRTCKLRLALSPTDMDRKLLKCEYCDEVFPSKSRLERHATKHRLLGTHKCQLCCRAYKHRHAMVAHMVKHHTGQSVDRETLDHVRDSQQQ
ncbi:hypothetical protein CSKR_113693 [Clonorchis sinensis]|uniref:C2H2-type domain-containing protein n=1 Tax=Clonorchis sinensis TaxID=79923 RepID=A0A419Q4Q6_CLOSI|nr:hypothetical protein CSKR_113693 [Clonorchis sinensis]